jgi:hypothetical protein
MAPSEKPRKIYPVKFESAARVWNYSKHNLENFAMPNNLVFINRGDWF